MLNRNKSSAFQHPQVSTGTSTPLLIVATFPLANIVFSRLKTGRLGLTATDEASAGGTGSLGSPPRLALHARHNSRKWFLARVLAYGADAFDQSEKRQGSWQF